MKNPYKTSLKEFPHFTPGKRELIFDVYENVTRNDLRELLKETLRNIQSDNTMRDYFLKNKIVNLKTIIDEITGNSYTWNAWYNEHMIVAGELKIKKYVSLTFDINDKLEIIETSDAIEQSDATLGDYVNIVRRGAARSPVLSEAFKKMKII